jgi:hypothetical protein
MTLLVVLLCSVVLSVGVMYLGYKYVFVKEDDEPFLF